MNIIILGAGQIGSTIARTLAKENNDVTVVDINSNYLYELQDQVDIATVNGAGTFPETLLQANIKQADILIAVMPSDEDNMVASQIAWSMFQAPAIIARIRNPHYLQYPELFSKNHIPVDTLINPESLVTQHLQDLIEYPGVYHLHDFADGLLKLVSIKVDTDAVADGLTIEFLKQQPTDFSCLLLSRANQILSLEKDTIINSGDQIFYLVELGNLRDSIALFHNDEKPYKRIILAGGGNIGNALAEKLEKELSLKIIEKSAERASNIAETLQKTFVLQGDATDQNLLKNEGIKDTDIFCALTQHDENNIFSCLMAKKLGARKTICLVNKSDYVDLIPGNAIDAVFSPGGITSGHILQYVRKSVINVDAIQDLSIEVIEIVIEGGEGNSRVIGLRADQLNLSEAVVLGALVRNNKVLRDRQSQIENRDHIILLCPENEVAAVVSYFQADV